MKTSVIALGLACAALLLAAPLLRAAEKGNEMPAAAKAEMKLAREAFGKKDWNAVLAHSRKAAELAPRSAEAQEEWISYHRFVVLTTMKPPQSDTEIEKIIDEYKKEAARAPKDPYFQILVGQVQYYENPQASRAAFERALKLDPKNTEALNMLGIIAETQGDNAGARQFFLRAAQANPNDPKAAGDYVGSFLDGGDFATFRDKALDLIHKFPDSPEAAKWYYFGSAPAQTRRKKGGNSSSRRSTSSPSRARARRISGGSRAATTSTSRACRKTIRSRRSGSPVRRWKSSPATRTWSRWFRSPRRQTEFNLARAARRAKDGKAALELIGSVEKAGGKYDSMKDAVAYEKALDQDAAGDSAAALETLLGMLEEGEATPPRRHIATSPSDRARPTHRPRRPSGRRA